MAPRQSRSRRSRWLCSVCERMRVQVLSRVDAFVTVCETLCGEGKVSVSILNMHVMDKGGGIGLYAGKSREREGGTVG